MNYARVQGFIMTALCFGASFCYFMQKDTRRGLYFFFAGCINTTVIF